MARYALAATALLASSAALASAHEDGPHDGSDAWAETEIDRRVYM